jgi:hypothetical protein
MLRALSYRCALVLERHESVLFRIARISAASSRRAAVPSSWYSARMVHRWAVGLRSGRAAGLFFGASLWSVAFAGGCASDAVALDPTAGRGGASSGGDASGGAPMHGAGTESEGGADAGESTGGNAGKSTGESAGGNAGGGNAGAPSEGGAAAKAGSAGELAASGAAGDPNSAGGGGAGPIGSIDLSAVDPNTLSAIPEPPGLADARGRAATLLATLTQSQKLALIRGGAGSYVGNVLAAVTPPYVVSPLTEIQLRSANTVTYTNGTNSDAALAAHSRQVRAGAYTSSSIRARSAVRVPRTTRATCRRGSTTWPWAARRATCLSRLQSACREPERT